jgi:hypothetical protein
VSEAQRGAELRAVEVHVKAAAEVELVKAAAEAQRVKAEAEVERAAVAEVAEQAAHWAAEMDKALAYRRDVDRNTAAQRDAGRRAETEQEAGRRADTEHPIEQCMTMRSQEAAISAAMAAIEAVEIGGHDDGGALL